MSFALVIDDNKQTTDVLIQMLKLWKVTARSALSPSSAMTILSGDTPAIVFLDINMPGVDGFEVLAYLRREPRLVKVPVIIVTSDDQPQTSKRAMDGGANAVIIKPVMSDILEKVLKKVGII
jgi:chemosensory pili system protein ChpA (sensor histidine kinase/response regulator)